MQFSEVKEIVEVFSPTKANEAIANGWTLIAVTSATSPYNNTQLAPCYIMGKKAPRKDPLPGGLGSHVTG